MDDKELARWVKEQLPRIKHEARKGLRLEIPAARDMTDAADALAALLALLGEAKRCTPNTKKNRLLALHLRARLRVVLGTGGSLRC